MSETILNLTGGREAVLVEQRRQKRRDRLVLMTLIELMAILVFVALAYALATSSAAELNIDWQKRYDAKVQELADERAKSREKDRELEELERVVNILSSLYSGEPLPTDPDEREAAIKDMEAQIEKIKREQSGSGDPTSRACEFPNGPLLQIHILEDDKWQAFLAVDPDQIAQARRIPGVTQIITPKNMTTRVFRRHAGEILRAGRALDENPCTYQAEVMSKISDVDVAFRKVNVVGQYFHPKPISGK